VFFTDLEQRVTSLKCCRLAVTTFEGYILTFALRRFKFTLYTL